MSRTVRPTSRFKKDLRLMKRKGKDLDKLEDVVNLLARYTSRSFLNSLKDR